MLLSYFQTSSDVAKPLSVTNQLAMIDRGSVGAAACVYLGNNTNSRIKVDGKVVEWQFYVEYNGGADFQVYRPRPDKGDQQ